MKDLRAALSKQPTHRYGPAEPIALFRNLKIRPGSTIQEMWAPQADALREWDVKRTAKDVLFQLNTGAGKTANRARRGSIACERDAGQGGILLRDASAR